MPTIVSHKYKFIFCHIPRTAGTSFTEAVRPFLGKDDEIDTFEKHTPLRKILKSRFRDVFDKYLKVAIIRDPQDRLNSLAVDPPENTKDTDEYWWNDDKWLYDDQGNILADVLLKFEELPGCAIDFLKRVGIDCKEFPHLNRR
jgi:hypothetical protein